MTGERRQKGVILVVALIFLLLISIVAVSGARRALVAERLGFNHWEQERAFQSAEAAVVDGRNWLTKLSFDEVDSPEGRDDGVGGIWTLGSVQLEIFDPAFKWSEEAVKFGHHSGLDTSWFTTPPHYLIENSGWVCDTVDPDECARGFVIYFYNVTGQGYGDAEHSRTVVQSTLSKRFR